MNADDLKIALKVIGHEMNKWRTLGPQECEDMASNALCVVLERWPRYDASICGKNAFITRCVTSANLDWYRRFFKPRLKPGEDLKELTAVFNNQAYCAWDVHAASADNQRADENAMLLRELADVLTDKEREVVSDLLNDLTLKEIGVRLSVTESRVSQIMQEIRRKMMERSLDEE